MNYTLRPEYSAEKKFVTCAGVFAEYAEKEFGIGWTEGGTGIKLAEDSSLAPEGYRIDSTPEEVVIKAAAEKGMHNALADLLSRIVRDGDKLVVPELSVGDSPDR